MCVGVSVWLVGVVPVWQAACHTGITQTSHTETPTHIETRTHNQCGDTIEKSQPPDDGCIKVRNMLNIDEVKQNLINCDIKLVSYSSTITMMHDSIYIKSTPIFETRYKACDVIQKNSVTVATLY